jgi:hypothetical protein
MGHGGLGLVLVFGPNIDNSLDISLRDVTSVCTNVFKV